jgi:dephospho-CoA kinase
MFVTFEGIDGSGKSTQAALLRDWLRAEPGERDGYAEVKRRLAGTSGSTDAYAHDKEPWFADAVPRALAWADRTGWTNQG